MNTLCRIFLCTALLGAAWSGIPAGARIVYERTAGVADTAVLPQSARAYLREDADVSLLDAAAQSRLAAECAARFFSPWDEDWPREHVEAFFAWDITQSDWWGGDLRPLPPARLREMIDRGDPSGFPSRADLAVAAADTPLRLLPAEEPLFSDLDVAGEGWPFDYAQLSAVRHGTPLRVLHTSPDGAWLFCVSNFAAGWMRARDVAFVDEGTARACRAMPLAAAVKEKVPLRKDGATVALARMGELFPRGESGPLVFLRGADGKAVLTPVEAPEGALAAFPLQLTRENVARLADRLTGRPYGWGGMNGERDCSATTRDLFAPFGLWLPRNSSAQAAKMGDFVSLEGLSDKEKLAAIRARAVPFVSLIGMTGHVGLYLGCTADGEPLILHNTWGMRLERADDPDLSGRLLIGRTVITTLRPGRERYDVSPRGLLPKVVSIAALPGLRLPEGSENAARPLALSASFATINADTGASAGELTTGRNSLMEERKNAVTMKGNPLTLVGPVLKAGDKAPDFCVVDKGLAPKTLKDYAGKIKVFSVAPSLDTPVCDLQATWFNEDADKLGDVVVLNFSMDLPFALGRYCAAKGFDKVDTLSDHRDASFGTAYGVLIKELRLLTRAVFVVDRDDVIRYVEIVPEVTNSINFDKLLEVVTELAK